MTTQAGRELARIERTARRVRLALTSAGVALGFAAVCTVVLLASLLPTETLRRPGSWLPMFLTFMAIAGCAGLGLAGRRYVGRHATRRLVPEVERSVGLRRGQLAGVLELLPGVPAGSGSLAQMGRQLVADQLASREDWELLPDTLRRSGRHIGLAAVALVVAAGALWVAAARSPTRTLAAATAVGQPWTVAFPPPPPRIVVAPGDTAVLRGDRLPVRVVAPLRDSVSLAWQPIGEAVRREPLALDARDTALGETEPIEAPTQYWIEAGDGTRSDVHRVEPLDPLLVTELNVRITYPAYLQRPAEGLTAIVGDLQIPAGTRLEIKARTNEPIETARLVERETGRALAFEVDGLTFSSDWRPGLSGTWSWELSPVADLPGTRPPSPFRLDVVPDLVPAVDVVYPGRDTAASVDLRLPMVVDARDDIGLQAVDLETWRVSAAGVRRPARIVPLWESLNGQRHDLRVVLRPVLRLDVLDLVPGDTLFYVARASDAHPGHGRAVSDTFRVFVPTLTELRRSAAASATELAEGSRELRDNAADLARAARDAQRRSEGRQSERGASEAGEFGATEEARRVLERGQDLNERVSDLERRMDDLREGSEESGLADASMREKFEQLEELFRQIEETGLGDQLRKLEDALRNLDARQAQQELGDLSSRLREMEARLEQTLALMERVATEQAMNDATDETRRLADRQADLAESFEADEAWAAEQADLAEQADRLLERLEEVRDQLEAQGLDSAADAVGQGMEQAAASSAAMQAAQSGSQGGEMSAQAAGQMQQAAESVEAASEVLNEDWKQEALEAVGRATSEALDLAREQAALGKSLEDDRLATDMAGRQASLVQGLDRLLESLSEAARRTALIDRTVGSTAADARERMQDLGEALGQRDGPPRGAAGDSRALVETLNDLAGRLMASRRAVESAGSATGMEEALDQLARMSQSQAGLNRESGGLMLMQQNGQPMEEALQRLAERQQEIARELEQLAQRPEARELPARPELLSSEADEIARELAGGRLDRSTLERQERLFRRLLDAGRSLERDEDPERRESAAADMSREGVVPDPRPDIESGPRYPYPDDRALSAVPRSNRKLILDYFDRLNAAEGPDR